MSSSSYIAYYFCKIAGAGLLFFGMQVPASLFLRMSFRPAHAPANTIYEPITGSHFLLALAVVAFLLAAGYVLCFRFRVIEYDDEHVRIIEGSDAWLVPWSNICQVTKIPCVSPPMYRMTFKNGRRPVYFIMSMFMFVSIGVWSWDFTGFYRYARSRITPFPL